MVKTLRTLSFILCLAMFSSVWAGVINENQALQVATRFMSSNSRTVSSMRLVQKAPSINASAASAYYVFNAEGADGGFVIVAGDDRAPAVLGYSDCGTFDARHVPEAMQALLDSYVDQIAALDKNGKVATHISATRPVQPLVKAQWSQNAPYNEKFPTLSNGNHAYVGCVATAMAQVMYYWKWPQRPRTTIPAYVTDELKINMPALPPIDFKWNLMQNTYLTDVTDSPEALAASELSLYCAQSVEMDFKDNASSASSYDIPSALYRYFDYSSTAKLVERRFYTTENWESMILDELRAKRPVIYSGRKASSGHAFVCDGYDGNGKFHINWGWNGMSNGYFLLNVLNPDLQGTGSASGTYGYIYNQSIIVDLHPQSTSSPQLEVYNRQIEIQGSSNTRTSSGQNFTITQETQFLNCSNNSISFNYGWGLYQNGNLVKILDSGLRENLNSWYYTRIARTLAFGSGITSGSYRIKPIYCEPYTSNWRLCTGSDLNYIEVEINGNNCTMTCHGAAMSPDYKVNGVSVSGNMHAKRPVDITLDVTNQGETRNDIIYMFANGKFISMGFIDLEKNVRGLVPFIYMPESAGAVNLTFSLDEGGTQVIASKQIVITQMPAATLSGSATVLNVTDVTNRIVTANEFAVKLVVTNTGSTTYDEDISIKLYKRIYGNTGTMVQAANQHVVLAPHQNTTLVFHLDNVMDGWRYFAKTYYYSSGDQTQLAGVSTYMVVFPEEPVTGDVNGDGEVNIADVNAVITVILNNGSNTACDVNGDGEVNIADVNAVIAVILNLI